MVKHVMRPLYVFRMERKLYLWTMLMDDQSWWTRLIRYLLLEALNFRPLVTTQTATYVLFQNHDFISRMSKLWPKLCLRCPYLSQLWTKMAQPVVKAATDQQDFALHCTVRSFCGCFIRWLSGQKNVNRRHHGHQPHVGSSDRSRRYNFGLIR